MIRVRNRAYRPTDLKMSKERTKNLTKGSYLVENQRVYIRDNKQDKTCGAQQKEEVSVGSPDRGENDPIIRRKMA